jgi:hypothetical protein
MAKDPKFTKGDKERIAKLTAELGDAEKAINQVLIERKILEDDSLDVLNERLDKYKGYVDRLKEVQGIQDRDQLIARQVLETNKVQLQIMEKEFKEATNLTAERQKEYEALKQIVEAQKEVLSTQEEINDEIGAFTDLQKKAYKGTMQWATAWKEKKMQALAAAKASMVIDKAASKMLTMFVDTTKELIFQLDSVTKEFEKTTQLNKSFTESIEETYKELNIYGATLEEVSKAQQELITHTSDFTLMAKGERDALLEVSTVLGDLGISTADFAQGVQNSIKYFNQSAMAARSTSLELKSTAEALGVVPGEMAAQYAKMGPALAKFGEQGVRAFKDLARIQKITGMEMQKVLNITNKFDTFEGAAEQAGKLNAALGGNFVNAMDLMMATDPAERFSMIRDSILDAGLSFDSMSYYQKQFYTESLGLADVGDLALLLSGDMDTLGAATNQSAKDLIDQKKKAQENMKIMEKLKSAVIEVAEAFMPLAQLLSTVATFFQTYTWVLKLVIGLMITWKLVTAAMAAVQAIATINMAYATMGLYAMASGNEALAASSRKSSKWIKILAFALGVLATVGLMMASPSLLVIAIFGLAGAMYALGRSSDQSAASIQRLAVPMLQVGAAIFLAAAGIALMAAAFSLLSTEQLIGLGIALVAVAAGIALIAVFGGPLAPVLAAVGAALVPLAFGILMIGAGIGIAAAGIGLMAAGLSLMFESIDVKKTLSLIGLIAALAITAPFLPIAAIGMMALTYGLLGLGLALRLIPTEDLQAIALFTSSLAELSVGQLREVAEMLERVAQAMEDIPTAKAMAVTLTMNAAKIAADAVMAMNRNAPPPASIARDERRGGMPMGEIAKLTINLQMDSKTFEKKVVTIVNTNDGIKARDALFGWG